MSDHAPQNLEKAQQKQIGLIGGMSWESSAVYYRLINQIVKRRLGGFHSARILLNSIDFSLIHQLQHSGDWDGTSRMLVDAAQQLERAGADFLMIGTNTMHKVAEQVEASVSLPLLHIADATGTELQRQRIKKIGLLGTAFTMEQEFYRCRIENRFGIEVIVPDKTERELVHRVIYDELCLGQQRQTSRQTYVSIIEKLAGNGAEGVILGCTEIGMLVNSEHTDVPLFDTTAIHAEAAVDWALDHS